MLTPNNYYEEEYSIGYFIVDEFEDEQFLSLISYYTLGLAKGNIDNVQQNFPNEKLVILRTTKEIVYPE